MHNYRRKDEQLEGVEHGLIFSPLTALPVFYCIYRGTGLDTWMLSDKGGWEGHWNRLYSSSEIRERGERCASHLICAGARFLS